MESLTSAYNQVRSFGAQGSPIRWWTGKIGSPAPGLVSGMTRPVATLRIIRDEWHPQFAHLFIGRPAPSHRAGV